MQCGGRILPEQVPVERAVLDGFGDMFGAYVVGAGEVGDRPPHLQDAVVRPGGESDFRDRHFEQFVSLTADPTELPDVARLHVRICEQPFPPPEPRRLDLTRTGHPLPDCRRGLAALGA